jgi:hypothetical protein
MWGLERLEHWNHELYEAQAYRLRSVTGRSNDGVTG